MLIIKSNKLEHTQNANYINVLFHIIKHENDVHNCRKASNFDQYFNLCTNNHLGVDDSTKSGRKK